MTNHTHQTAPTQYAQAKGIRFAYRRFGSPGTRPWAQATQFLDAGFKRLDGASGSLPFPASPSPN